MVLDTSALLAVLMNEKGASKIVEELEHHRSALRMSTVNLTELLILIEDRQPHDFSKIEDEILASGIRFVPPTIGHARIAAKARARFPLNLGDCFAYALAKIEGCPLLTLDRDFKKTDIDVVMPG